MIKPYSPERNTQIYDSLCVKHADNPMLLAVVMYYGVHELDYIQAHLEEYRQLGIDKAGKLVDLVG